jgi:hypothetical protein
MSFYHKNINHISTDEKKNLSNKYFLLKNTVFISNIPKEIFSKETLYEKKFLAQYGHINRLLLINNNKIENSLIVQFDTINQAALCIISLDNLEIKEKEKIKSNYYNTKYCNSFLNNKECKNPICLFIHSTKLNNYLYKEINPGEYINSFKYALLILDVPLSSFNLIYEKLIGEKYFEKKGKFPKITLKKLKKIECNNNLSYNHLIKEENQKSNDVNLPINNIKIYESYLKNLYNISNNKYQNNNRNNISFSNYKLNYKQFKHSRFVSKNINENDKDKVYIPDSVKEIINKIIEIYMNNKIRNNVQKNIYINNIDFNKNLSELILHLNLVLGNDIN